MPMIFYKWIAVAIFVIFSGALHSCKDRNVLNEGLYERFVKDSSAYHAYICTSSNVDRFHIIDLLMNHGRSEGLEFRIEEHSSNYSSFSSVLVDYSAMLHVGGGSDTITLSIFEDRDYIGNVSTSMWRIYSHLRDYLKNCEEEVYTEL